MYAMDTKEFKKLTDAEIKEVIEVHKKWLENPQEGSKADFSFTDLSGVNFSDLDLRCANFNGAKLNNANFSNTNLWGADFPKAKLNDAIFYGADLRCANFNGANLSHATMTKCLLSCANFIKTNLHCVNLFNSLLDKTDFKGANLNFSNLSLSHQIYNANFDDDAILRMFYHTLMIVAKSKNVSPELKSFFLTKENTKKANEYSEVKEGWDGKIYPDGTVGSYYEFNY